MSEADSRKFSHSSIAAGLLSPRLYRKKVCELYTPIFTTRAFCNIISLDVCVVFILHRNFQINWNQCVIYGLCSYQRLPQSMDFKLWSLVMQHHTSWGLLTHGTFNLCLAHFIVTSTFHTPLARRTSSRNIMLTYSKHSNWVSLHLF